MDNLFILWICSDTGQRSKRLCLDGTDDKDLVSFFDLGNFKLGFEVLACLFGW